MLHQRVQFKHATYIKKSKIDRLGTIVGENHKKTSWWIQWDGLKGRIQIKKNLLTIVSNQADIVNSILIHKLNQK